MKKISALVMMVIVVYAAVSQEVGNTKFRNLEWGGKIDSLYTKEGTKLEFVKDKYSVGSARNAYLIENDDMYVGNVKLRKLNYVFNDDNRFTKVLMEGAQEDANQMKFILTYKFGDHKNESRVDGVSYFQWLVKDVTFTLAIADQYKFEVKIESNWQATEAYKKNTTVDDF